MEHNVATANKIPTYPLTQTVSFVENSFHRYIHLRMCEKMCVEGCKRVLRRAAIWNQTYKFVYSSIELNYAATKNNEAILYLLF